MNYGAKILHALLDSYERSAQGRKALVSPGGGALLPGGATAYVNNGAALQPKGPGDTGGEKAGGKPARRSWFHFNRKNLPAYFDDSSAGPKNEINEWCLALAEHGLVEIHWVKHEKGNLIEKVALNPGAVAEAYRYLGRKPRAAAAGEVCALARHYAKGSPGWVASFFDWVVERVEKGESVARYFDLEEPERAELLFRALREAGRLSEETPRRFFSLQALGHSKTFDSIAGALARAARDFHPAFRGGGGEYEAWEQKEVLAELGLVDNPQHLFISGPLRFTLNGRHIDAAAFTPDLGLPAEAVAQMVVEEIGTERVVTVENLTSYYQFIRQSGGRLLTVYLGGYHNSPRRLFLTKLKEHLAASGRKTSFHHWGDIDYGGFTIFQHLRARCGLDLLPLHMDLATLKRYEKFAVSFDRSYGQRLRRLLEKEEYGVFHEVIHYMLEKSIRLEQEIVQGGV